MQAREEHVHAEEGEGGDQQAGQRPPRGNLTAQTLDETHVQPCGVVQPDDQRPGFLRVPAPVAAPGLGGPQRTQNGGDGEEGEADGDGLIHHIIHHFQRGQMRGDATAAIQNTGHDQRRDTGEHAPVLGDAALTEHQRLEEHDKADQPQRRELPQGSLVGMGLDEVSEADHGRDGEGAVADEVRRDVQLHPPALQRRHQRLNFIGVLHHAVPQQEAHRRADHQHGEGAHAAGLVFLFEIQIQNGGQPGEQHEHFVQVRQRNVADIRPDLIALIPAHHGADQRHGDAHPGQTRTEVLREIGLPALGVAHHAVAAANHRPASAGQRHACCGILRRAGEHAEPVGCGAQEHQERHPQNRRLAGEEVLEEKHLFTARQHGVPIRPLIQPDAEERQARDDKRQVLDGRPPPSEEHQRRRRSQENELDVIVHVLAVLAQHIRITTGDEQ